MFLKLGSSVAVVAPLQLVFQSCILIFLFFGLLQTQATSPYLQIQMVHCEVLVLQ